MSGVRPLKSGDLIHIGDRVEVSVAIYPSPYLGKRQRQGEEVQESGRRERVKVQDCPYILSQWNPVQGKVVGSVLPFSYQPPDQPSGRSQEATDSAAGERGSWVPSTEEAGGRKDDMWLSARHYCSAASQQPVNGAGETEAAGGARTAGSSTRQCNCRRSGNRSDFLVSGKRDDAQRTATGESMEPEETLDPVVAFLLLKIHGGARQEPIEVWADPRGVLLGRGPQNFTTDLKKVSKQQEV